MSHYLWEMRPYFRQVAGQLVLGSIAGLIMNIAVVLPAILLWPSWAARSSPKSPASPSAGG